MACFFQAYSEMALNRHFRFEWREKVGIGLRRSKQIVGGKPYGVVTSRDVSEKNLASQGIFANFARASVVRRMLCTQPLL